MADWQKVGTYRRGGQVVLDGSGDGQIYMDVASANHKWVVKDIVLTTNQAQTTAPYPNVTVYLTGQQAGVSEGASWLGNQDTMHGEIEVGAGDTLIVVFTGGVPGVIATARAEGDNYLWR